MEELEEVINKLKTAFKEGEIKATVLLPEWIEVNRETGIDSAGFCYAACEVIYKKTGGKANWKIGRISRQNWKEGGHCFLIDKKTEKILDITADQYLNRGIEIPYDLAKVGGGFFRESSTERAEKLSIAAGLGSF